MYDYGRIWLEFGGKRQNELSCFGIDIAYKYLQDRGISIEDIDRLGIVIAPAREVIANARGTTAFGDDTRLAIVFKHIAGHGGDIDWWSARLVETDSRPPPHKTFIDLIAYKARGKMFCPPGEAPHAYFVPTLDWSLLAKGDNVYIHESCIKAFNGANLGYWSIGLNGVRGWSARKHGITLLEELRTLPWKALNLNPIIVFDSNAAENWDVQLAMGSLAAKIYEFSGQRSRHLLLPKNADGNHWGFDDFVVSAGVDAARRYLDTAAEAPVIDLSEIELKKIQLNAEVCVVRSLGRIAEQKTGYLMSRAAFTDVNYASWTARNDDDKFVSVPRLWLMDERRVEVEKLEYSPGSPAIVPRGAADSDSSFLNLWRGMGVEPANGECELWQELLEKQVMDATLRKWFLQWMAYPLQNLGAKMNAYVHLYGPPGIGKNAILQPLLEIYGCNGVVMGKDQIASTFNSIYSARQFVNLDEMHGGSDSGALSISNRIKGLVTSSKLVVNTKGQPEYEVTNCVNLVTTSNYSDSIKFDEGERRACVIKFEGRMGQEWWDTYFKDIRAAQVYSFLLDVDMTGFNPGGAAPDTQWKEMVIDATRDAMTKWVRDLSIDPDSVLPEIAKGVRFLTPEQLGAAYYPGEPGKNTPSLRNQIGLRMNDAGFERTGLISVGGAMRRFWVIRKGAWTNDEIRSEYTRYKDKLKF